MPPVSLAAAAEATLNRPSPCAFHYFLRITVPENQILVFAERIRPSARSKQGGAGNGWPRRPRPGAPGEVRRPEVRGGVRQQLGGRPPGPGGTRPFSQKTTAMATRFLCKSLRNAAWGVGRVVFSETSEKVVRLAQKCKLAHAFLREYSYKRLKLAQLLGQLGAFLTIEAPNILANILANFSDRALRPPVLRHGRRPVRRGRRRPRA